MSLRDESASGHRAFALPGSRYQYGPDRVVEVEHIDLHLTPDIENRTLNGVCTTTVRAFDDAVDRLTLDAVDMEILFVKRDGEDQAFESRSRQLEIRFAVPIAARESAAFSIGYRVIDPRAGLFFVEPTADYPAAIRHAWTQSQDQNARHWFPCLDYPAGKQTTSETIVVPRGTFALGNGALVERFDDGDSTTFRYRQEVPHSTYLMTMVAGPFVEVSQGTAGAGNVPVFYYVLPGRESEGDRSFGNTPRMIDVFEERIGTPYPYARYSQIAVADFIFGGMENTSATTQTDRTLHDAVAHLDFSSDPLVCHELAHQWFGDLLTCRDWSHAWLNEGFATYFESVWHEANLGYDEYEYDVLSCVAGYLAEDGERYRRPIVWNQFIDPIELFDRHLYEKGGAVLHMLRGELGDVRFWRAIRHYVASNAGRNVETIDLIRAIEEATGRNVRGYFDQWVFRGGHPDVEVSVSWDAERKAATVRISQKQPIDAANPAYQFDVDLGFVPSVPEGAAANFGIGPLDGERRVRAHVDRADETISVPLDFEPKLVRFDPGAFVLGSVKYAFGPEFAAAALRGDPGVGARIRAARELSKDGSQTARSALREAFGRDPFWGVLVETARALGRTRATWAREILLDATRHVHPKVRRAAAEALGEWNDPDVVAALTALAAKDDSYFVRSACYASLGKTRDPRAFDVLVKAAKERTWNSTVESGAIRGLAELADERALEPILDAARLGHDEGLRRAAAACIGRVGQLVEGVRTRCVLALERLLDDPMFLVQLAAISAAESLGDPRLLPALARLVPTGADGRIRRHGTEAAMRIREDQKVPAQVAALRDDLNEIRAEQNKLRDKIETLARP